MPKNKKLSLTQAAIPLLKAAMPKRNRIPILDFIKVFQDADGFMYAAATDLDTWVNVRVNDDTPAGLYAIIGKELVLANDTTAKLENFPSQPVFTDAAASFTVPVEIIRNTIPFISKEESRYTLNGMLIQVPSTSAGKVTVAATDGHRLRVQYSYVHESPEWKLPENTGRYVIPFDLCKLIVKFVSDTNVRMAINANAFAGNGHIRVQTDSFVIYGRAVSGQFPNWEAVMMYGEQPVNIVFNRESFLEALEQVKPFTDERTGCVGISFAEDGETITFTGKRDNYQKDVVLSVKIQDSIGSFDAQKFLNSGYLSSDPAICLVMPLRGSEGKLSFNVAYLIDAAKSYSGTWMHMLTKYDLHPATGQKRYENTASFSDQPFILGETATTEELADIQESNAAAYAETIRVAREMAVAHPEEAKAWNSKADHLEATVA